ESKEENIFVSPLSLHIALGMLLNGSEGETREGIIKAIRAEGLTPDDLNAAYQTLMRELPEADKKVQLALANSMWYREGFEVKNSFKQVLADIFSSQIYDEPFDGGTVKKINQWASDHTAGKIDQRSEEHTSELQSRENLVCRLLLEKKKQPRHRRALGKL